MSARSFKKGYEVLVYCETYANGPWSWRSGVVVSVGAVVEDGHGLFSVEIDGSAHLVSSRHMKTSVSQDVVNKFLERR